MKFRFERLARFNSAARLFDGLSAPFVVLVLAALSACAPVSVTNPATGGDPTAASITTQPQSESVALGATATFSVVASGTAPLSYQWSKNGTAIAGATSSSYTTPETVSGDDGATFSVMVSNSAGSQTSSAATLSVTAAPVAPSITTQPADQSVTLGATATFSVMASGTAPLSYQWSKNGTAIAGATGLTYTTPATATGDNGATFSVVVSNSAGSKTSNAATLSVTATAVAPSISTQPASQSVALGATATFSVVASGTAPLSYQWSKNGSTIGGATGSSYTTPATVSGDNGATFSVVVSNSAGSKTSNAATLSVTATAVAPSISTQPASQSVALGATATFSVVASGTAPLSYQWSKNGSTISGATGSSYTTPATVSGDNGATFSVVVSNSAGSKTSNSATLTVSGAAPSITTQPANQSVALGATATFSVVASGTAPLSYQWSKNGSTIGGAMGSSYTTPATVSGDNGATFSVVVSNSAGSKTSNAATLSVTATAVAPSISTQPASQSVALGATATFSVVASGTAPLSYQWSKNGSTIGGATGSSYTTPATVSGDNGATFSVVVSNSAGSKTSNPATLSVTSSGVTVTLSPRRAGVTTGQLQTFTATVTGTANTSVTWTVDGVAGGNGSVGTVSAGGVYTPPGTAGTHTITATSVANPAQSASASVVVTDLAGIVTQRYDVARTGQNLQEYALTPALLATSGAFGKLFSCSVDGAVYAQPLYVANLAIGGGVHNVVFVATEHDSVYAFDADASPCVQYWKTSFLGSGVTTVPPADINDTDDLPGELGITGTPVINVALNTLYVVANTKESGPSYPYRLHALNLASGAEQANSPQLIQASYGGVTFDPRLHMQRPGLLYLSATNTVYVAFGSHGDYGTYYGWVLGYNPTTLQQTVVFNTAPSQASGSIWMSGAGPAADPSGAIYVSTANGPFDASNTLPPTSGANDFGDTVLKLNATSNLAVSDFFTPADQSTLNSDDWDLGSGGVTVLPDAIGAGTAHPHLAVAGDKEAKLFLIDRDNMGKYSSGSNANLQTLHVNNQGSCVTCGIFSNPTVWGTTLYVGAINDTVKAYPFSGGLLPASPASQSADVYQFPGAETVISASGSTNGVLWALDTNSAGQTGSTSNTGPAVLRAYDATNLANRLWSSDALAADAAVNAVKFIVPTVANGKVYVVGQGKLTVYGLLP